MPDVRDVVADVVQQRRVLEDRPLALGEPVLLLRSVEDRQGQSRDVARVGLVVQAPLRKLDDAAGGGRRIRLGACKRLRMAVHVVDHDPLAEPPLAEGDLPRAHGFRIVSSTMAPGTMMSALSDRVPEA